MNKKKYERENMKKSLGNVTNNNENHRTGATLVTKTVRKKRSKQKPKRDVIINK